MGSSRVVDQDWNEAASWHTAKGKTPRTVGLKTASLNCVAADHVCRLPGAWPWSKSGCPGDDNLLAVFTCAPFDHNTSMWALTQCKCVCKLCSPNYHHRRGARAWCLCPKFVRITCSKCLKWITKNKWIRESLVLLLKTLQSHTSTLSQNLIKIDMQHGICQMQASYLKPFFYFFPYIISCWHTYLGRSSILENSWHMTNKEAQCL